MHTGIKKTYTNDMTLRDKRQAEFAERYNGMGYNQR